jgi:hypothetical protein
VLKELQFRAVDRVQGQHGRESVRREGEETLQGRKKGRKEQKKKKMEGKSCDKEIKERKKGQRQKRKREQNLVREERVCVHSDPI